MPSTLTQVGAYPLTGTGKLPNAQVAHPGEVWSRKRAATLIVPGSCVFPTKDEVKVLGSGDTVVEDDAGIRKETLAVALRQIAVPDINPGSQYNPQLGPNEIVNLPIAEKDWVRTYHTGVMHLTLVQPYGEYEEGDIIGWAPLGDRPKLKTAGFGSWFKVGAETENAEKEEVATVSKSGIFIVEAAPRYYGTANEAILTCRFLRSNQ